MILDKRTQFADNVALGGSTGRRLVGDVIDLEDARDIGSAYNIWLVIQLSVAMTSAGAATINFELVSDAQAAIAVDGTATVHVTSPTMDYDSKVAGDTLFQVIIPIESEDVIYERYLGVIANVGTAALTAGSINAFLTLQPPVHKSYPDGAR